MGRFKLALALGFLLALNLVSVSPRPYDEDEDDDFGNLFGDSDEEKSEEAPPPPPKAPEVDEDEDDLWGASESKEESKEAPPPPAPAPRALPPPPPPPAAPAGGGMQAQEADEDDDYMSWGNSEEETKAEDKVDSHSHHHNHNHNLQDGQVKALNPPQEAPPAPKAPAPPAPAAPGWGSNVAGFNESCLTVQCNSDAHLTCDSTRKVCACINSYTYIRSQERCFPIPTETNQDCEFNDQCHAARWGRLSRCDRSKARCECYDIDMSGSREMKRVAGVCLVLKNIYEPCSNTSECATVDGAVICDYPAASINPGQAPKQCRCDHGHFWDNRAKSCLPVNNELGSDCSYDDQCMLGKLGELSRCPRETAKCECHDPANPGQENVVLYKPRGRCFAKKDWNSTCREDDECRASISSKGECLPDPEREEGSDDKTCQCPQGKVCPRDADEGDGGLLVGSSGLFTLSAFVATLVYARL